MTKKTGASPKNRAIAALAGDPVRREVLGLLADGLTGAAMELAGATRTDGPLPCDKALLDVLREGRDDDPVADAVREAFASVPLFMASPLEIVLRTAGADAFARAVDAMADPKRTFLLPPGEIGGGWTSPLERPYPKGKGKAASDEARGTMAASRCDLLGLALILGKTGQGSSQKTENKAR